MVFVLNVAISQTGKAHVKREYRALKKLNREFPIAVLPQAYGFDEIDIRNDHLVGMFLVQWFDNYHEFHISRDPADKKNKIVVWDSKKGNDFLSADQSRDLYTQAAGILTGYYNLESFEQITSWHHAAGDFIVYRDHTKIDLKLISVRRYASRFKHLANRSKKAADAELILQTLLVFFLNLSLRMRLDRLDGVGDMVWADDIAVQGTLIGFLNALGLKPQVAALPDSALRCFFHYLSECSKTDLLDISETVLSTFSPDSPEVDVIGQHLNNHIDILHHCIHQL